MPRRPDRLPSYRLHRPSGQAVVTLSGRDFYLGEHGSEASRAEYDRLIALWVAGGRKPLGAPAEEVSVSEVLAAYLKHAQVYYRKGNEPTSQWRMAIRVARDLKELYGPEPASTFGPLKFKALRQRWVDKGLARDTCNQQAAMARRIFRWAVGEELVPPGVDHALRAVPGLKSGRTEAPDHPPVTVVPDEHVAAILPFLKASFRACVQIQDLTGCRPGEVLRIRPCDVDRSGPVWKYTPPDHKTSHHNKARVILIGPQAQAVLTPWLERQRHPQGYLFHAPERDDRRRAARLKRGNRRPPPYALNSYQAAIEKACAKAKVPPFSPNRLRHNSATRLRKRYGIEAARIILGHSDLKMTQLYAEADVEKAIAIALETG